MNDQAHATETISIIKEVSLNNREALNYITGLMRKYVGNVKYVTWKAEIKDNWFYVRIAQTDACPEVPPELVEGPVEGGEAARELHIPTRLYAEGKHDLLDTELANLVGKFMEEVQNVR